MNSIPNSALSHAEPKMDDDAFAAGATAAAPSFASKSLSVHLARGTVGFGSIAASITLAPVIGWVSLLLLPVGLVALRGCPACWAIGLVQTMSQGRLRRECADGRCQLTSTPPPS
ncbi:hypothetical protein ACFRH4_30805 [Streptomyces mirabilis]|uniref:hypothetical protein n=1 Tax=Streptomyces mirabilis TaxID=68239 RepID=UPI0036B594C3